MTDLYLTRFQFLCVRTVFAFYLAALFFFILPNDITPQNLALTPERWDLLYNPFLKFLWHHGYPAHFFWQVCGALSLLLVSGFRGRWISMSLLIIWMLEFNLSVFKFDPGSFLIAYGLLVIYDFDSSHSQKYLFPLFWVLFFFTCLFDFMASLNTLLDLFPFGMKFEHTFLPGRPWLYLRVGSYLIFWFAMLSARLRWLGWVALFIFHWVWSIHFGFTVFSGTQIVVLLFLFNPKWTTTPSDPKIKPYVFYDGVCVLCDNFTRFLFAEDFAHHFFYAPLQGPSAKQKLPRGYQNNGNSIIYFDEGKCFYRLDAVIKIFSEVGGIWHLINLLWLLPASIRDRLYNFVANHRYNWFGTLNYCRYPTPEERLYFRE